MGPFLVNPLPVPLVTSPLQTVSKSVGTDRRVVVNLSFPFGHSVNDGIPKDQCLGTAVKVRYPSVDAFARMVQLKGQGCVTSKGRISVNVEKVKSCTAKRPRRVCYIALQTTE